MGEIERKGHLQAARESLDDYPAIVAMHEERTERAEAEVDSLRQQLRGAVEALRGVLSGRIVRDETENGDPILLDLSTDPATVVRLNDFGGQ